MRSRLRTFMNYVKNASRPKSCITKLPFSYTNQLIKFMSVVLHSTLHSLTTLYTTQIKNITWNFVLFLRVFPLVGVNSSKAIEQGRQLKFEILRNNRSKIGMNIFSNKFYRVSKLIGLDYLNLTFVHFKKLWKFSSLRMVKLDYKY